MRLKIGGDALHEFGRTDIENCDHQAYDRTRGPIPIQPHEEFVVDEQKYCHNDRRFADLPKEDTV